MFMTNGFGRTTRSFADSDSLDRVSKGWDASSPHPAVEFRYRCVCPTHVLCREFLVRKEELEHLLEGFSGIDRVEVDYSSHLSGREARAVCSDGGTTATVTFARVSLEVKH